MHNPPHACARHSAICSSQMAWCRPGCCFQPAVQVGESRWHHSMFGYPLYLLTPKKSAIYFHPTPKMKSAGQIPQLRGGGGAPALVMAQPIRNVAAQLPQVESASQRKEHQTPPFAVSELPLKRTDLFTPLIEPITPMRSPRFVASDR